LLVVLAMNANTKGAVMKKLALIGMVVAGLLLSTSVALAKPTGMTKAEYQALVARSDGMNQRYGLSQGSLTREKLGEIGAWAIPSKQTQSKPLVSEKLSGLNLPTDTTVASSSQGFDWNDAGIGAVLALAGVLGVGAMLTVRHQHQHKPIPH
jgi:hypothetical protein